LQKKLLKFQQKLNIQERLKIMGYTLNLYDWLARADVFVTASVYEGNPNTVIEAIACKCPVVVSKIPAHSEFLDESSAFFVSPSSPQSIADGILGALSDSEQAGEKAGRAWERVADWSADSIAREYIEACEEILTARLRNRRDE
jgi:glycosyltransferase involved in cell wall biosynthesis